MTQVCHITFRKEIPAAPKLKALIFSKWLVYVEINSASLENSDGPSRAQSKSLLRPVALRSAPSPVFL